MKKVHLLFFLFLAFSISCSSSGDDDPKPDDEVYEGEFALKLTGDINKSISGTSGFSHAILTSKDKFENGSTLSIAMTTDVETDVITILVGELGNLSGIKAGTYIIDDEADEGDPVALVAMVLNTTNAYVSLSGEVKITKIEKTKVTGSVSAILIDGGGKTVNISGTFEAIGITSEI